MTSITINGITVDPDTQQEEIAATGLSAADAEAANRMLIQTEHPLDSQVRQQLSDLGLHVHRRCSRRASNRRTCLRLRTPRPHRRGYPWRWICCCTPTSCRTTRSSSGSPP